MKEVATGAEEKNKSESAAGAKDKMNTSIFLHKKLHPTLHPDFGPKAPCPAYHYLSLRFLSGVTRPRNRL